MSDTAQEVAPKRPGVRRSERAHKAIIEATGRLLREIGYHDLTIESIASAAGVGKATIYRWWPSKAAVVLDTLIAALPEPRPTGDLPVRDGLYDSMTRRKHRLIVDGTALTALMADLWHGSPELLQKLRVEWLAPSQQEMREYLERGIADGTLDPRADVDLILDIFSGAQILRSLMTGRQFDPGVARRLVDSMLAAPPLRDA
jgi:AcrR family transcriptional regulator